MPLYPMTPPSPTQQMDDALASLQKQWRWVVLVYALGLTALGLYLRLHLSLMHTLLWLGMSGIIGFYILSYLYVHLPDHRGPGDLIPRSQLGPGTLLSLAGGWCLAAMGGFMLLPRPQGLLAWLPAILFLAALLADLLDGIIARRTGLVTQLGADLDMTLDGLGVLLASTLAVIWGQWPFWFIIVGLARYLFLAGLAWRQRRGLPVQPLEDSVIRRLLAGLQRGFLWVALWPVLPPWLTTATGLAFVIPFLVNFTYDWLVASTVIDDRDPDFRAILARWQRFAYGPGALVIRIITGLGLWVVWGQAWRQGRMIPWHGASVWVLGGAILSVLLLVGIAPRLVAVMLYGPVVWLLLTGVSFWPALFTFYGLTGIILLGPGPYALWQPEVRLFTRRLGEIKK